jgi:uncharacterized Tic20 family protein
MPGIVPRPSATLLKVLRITGYYDLLMTWSALQLLPDTPISPDESLRIARLQQTNLSGEAKPIQPMRRSYSTLHVSPDERLWAALAHASIWITLLGGILTIGFIIPISIFIPLLIYLKFRRRSDYVVFHSMQAFLLQIIATIGVAVLAAVGGLVWILGMLLALLSVTVLIGVLLVPLWAVVGIVLGVLVLGVPLAALALGTIAALQTYHKIDYRYPFIARWVDRQLAGGFLDRV